MAESKLQITENIEVMSMQLSVPPEPRKSSPWRTGISELSM